MIRKITFIINSLKKLPSDVKELLSYCENKFGQENVDVLNTLFAGHGYELSFNACNQKTDLIIGIGGDGTFHEIINGIITSDNKNTIFALIPNGTGNDFCKAQQINFSKSRFIKALDNPNIAFYDLCLIQLLNKSTYFLNIADVGFGGHTAHILNAQRAKGLGGGLSYSLAILRSFVTYKKPDVKLILDGHKCYEGPIMMIAFCNSSTFGNGLIINPEASAQDGVLNISLLADVGFWDYVKNFLNLKSGKRIMHKNVFYKKCQSASVKIISGHTSLEADGEIIGKNDFTIDVKPSCLKVLKY